MIFEGNHCFLVGSRTNLRILQAFVSFLYGCRLNGVVLPVKPGHLTLISSQLQTIQLLKMKFNQVWWRVSAGLCPAPETLRWSRLGKRHPQLEQENLVTNVLAAWTQSPKLAAYKRGGQSLSSPTAWGKWGECYFHCSEFVNSESYQSSDFSLTVVLLNLHSKTYSACCLQIQANRGLLVWLYSQEGSASM